MSITGFMSYLWNQGVAASTEQLWKPEYGTIGQLKMKDIDGNDFDFTTLEDKVVILTSVACGCGFTKEGYKHMVGWKNQFKDEKFEVLGFPSNTFAQELRENESIKEYVQEHFGLNFPLMEKSDVNGDDQNPVFQWLKMTYPGEIQWNFGSYFVLRNGKPIARFEKESWETITDALRQAIDVNKAEAEAEGKQ